jgi:hypothetical protein
MITFSLGYIKPVSTTNGTVATANLPSLNPPGLAPTSLWVQAVSFQAIESNLGIVYICDTPNPNFTTGIGILWKVPVPDPSKKQIPAWVIGDPSRPNNPVNVAQYYIVPANSGEGVGVAAVRSGTQQTTLT